MIVTEANQQCDQAISAKEQRRTIIFSGNSFALVLVVAAMVQPDLAVADHVPDNLSQDVDPNYIACLMAVDDAKLEFLGFLQETCFIRMLDLCGGREGDAPPSQTIDCIYFETHRGINFLQSAATDLPETVENGGFFERGYKKRRDSVLGDVKTIKTSPKPTSIEIAIRQSVTMAASAQMLFYLARETGTLLDLHVAATFGGH